MWGCSTVRVSPVLRGASVQGVTSMIDVNDAGQLISAGRRKIVFSTIQFGVPTLLLLAAIWLQSAGVIHLEQEFDPEGRNPGVVWQALGVLTAMLALFWAFGLVQGTLAIRRGRRLRP